MRERFGQVGMSENWVEHSCEAGHAWTEPPHQVPSCPFCPQLTDEDLARIDDPLREHLNRPEIAHALSTMPRAEEELVRGYLRLVHRALRQTRARLKGERPAE